ncbi:MAG: hypothetical protein JNJ98_14120 [Gemmatimonadetes bacterium]|nr:hypothetical protein [Gemmatimonadota bacterium]
MALEPQSLPWASDRAVVLVHGIGNAKPGDYQELKAGVEAALGPAAADTAVYQLFYDQVNDWFAAKSQLGTLLTQAVSALSGKIADPQVGDSIADTIGDVLWPVLVADARTAVREAYLAQLKQVVADGNAAGVRTRDQKLTIICHSLGCFHTYEVLHHASQTASHRLRPSSEGVRFANVIFMASPVQLIRTVAEAMGPLVPNRRWLYTVQGDALSIPGETTVSGRKVSSVERWVSITGKLDPVGGWFFRNQADWASMNVPGQETFFDEQNAFNVSTRQEWANALKPLVSGGQPKIQPTNPHSWEVYVANHATQLRDWILA